MKIKLTLFLLSMIIFYSNSYSDTIKADTDEVIVDLNTNTLVAENGISVNSNNISGLFYKLERDPNTEILKFSNNALVNVSQPTGNIKIETNRGVLDRLKEKGEFYDNFAYINVAKATGAEAPNDKIYFGSPYMKYEAEKIYFKDGWITTDFKIVNHYNEPKEVGYHLFSKETIIEPDKQVTLLDTDLFIGKRDVIPFSLPWFRANIRQNSKVPLFPTFTSSDDYGFQTMWGVLYGNRNDKYRGGIAPKFADKMGFLIGRWENWYKSDLGETRLDIDDLLLYSKAKKDSKTTNIGDIANYEKRNKRYRVSLTHNYSDEKGYFYFKSVNSTRSMVGNLTEVMEKFDNNSVYKTWKINREEYDKNIGFYTLDADLKSLGEDKDLSLKADVSLVSDKKGYGLIVYDSIDDIAYGSSVDHDLYSNVKVEKDNSKYRLAGRYNYLYDMDPGSNPNDLKSRDENIGAEFLHKESGFEVSYDKRRGDEYRNIPLWEKDIKTRLKQKNILGIDMNYVPTTVTKYDKNNYEKISAVLGKYNFGTYTFTPNINYEDREKSLDLTKDLYRNEILGNSRISDYNRFENTIYDKSLERRIDFKLTNQNEEYNFAIGKTKTEIWDREGLFDGTYRIYENDSNFYEALLGRKNIETSFGTFAGSIKFRQDSYKGSNDRTNDFNLKLGHNINLYSNRNTKIDNDLTLEFQRYNFSGNKLKEEQRLIDKDNYIKVSETVNIKTDKADAVFKTTYKQAEDSYGKKDLSNRIYTNELTVNLADDRKFKAFYAEDKRYTSKTLTENNLNDLLTRNYGFNFDTKKHGFAFSNLGIKFDVYDVVSPIEAREKISENRFSYSYKREKDKITISYAQGKDKVETSNNNHINKRNTDYSILYNSFGKDIDQDIYLSYSENYYGGSDIRNSIRNTDVYRFSYTYKDKRFEKEELIKYATLEYEKPKEDITSEDVQAIKTILDRSQNLNRQFELTRISDETFRIGNYKKAFKFYVTMEKNDKRYSQTGDLMKSLSKLEGGLTYTYNRVGIGYEFTEKANWQRIAGNYTWKKNSREHELSVYAKIGKPSEGWKIKTYARFYDNLANRVDAKANRKKSLDGIGIELGKEMGFYEWAVSYENRYSPSTKNYEWRAGVHFTLLTFPNNSLFGFGAKDNGNRKTKSEIYLFDRPSPLNDK